MVAPYNSSFEGFGTTHGSYGLRDLVVTKEIILIGATFMVVGVGMGNTHMRKGYLDILAPTL